MSWQKQTLKTLWSNGSWVVRTEAGLTDVVLFVSQRFYILANVRLEENYTSNLTVVFPWECNS
jgi:hypothetical protein